ncbi:phosphotransferase family protein [Deinococcus apachensis]|uniref:phosphotransferase family protein n=1 Tax=Deinococcus apachensis TaxID=309886 RepID=UPI00035EBA89|nr:phosphotransferase [Deinococcus apachensis]
MLLPEPLTYDAFLTLHAQPLAPWRAALEAVRERHALPGGDFTRFRLGKNAVFAVGEAVVKLVPPFWAGDARREAAALRAVRGRLPLATPELLAGGALGKWAYLVTRRLPGRPLREVWGELSEPEQVRLAVRQAELLRAVQALPLPADLPFDWPGLLLRQGLELPRELRAPPVLARGAEAFLLDVVWNGPGFARAPVFLHGDLNFLNLLLEEQGGWVTLTGLIDWSDARGGPPAHDLISPAVNQFRRWPAARRAWAAALHLSPEDVREATARALLYYPDEWEGILSDLGVPGARTWEEVGAALLGMS